MVHMLQSVRAVRPELVFTKTALFNGISTYSQSRLVMMIKPDFVNWRTSTYTNDGASCVHVAQTVAWIGVEDTNGKRQDAPILVFGLPAWRVFVAAVASGELNPQ